MPLQSQSIGSVKCYTVYARKQQQQPLKKHKSSNERKEISNCNNTTNSNKVIK